MTVVEFNNQNETIKRSLYEIYGQYFDGGTHTVNQTDIVFYNAKIVFNVDEVIEEHNEPRIAFTGNRASGSELRKCEDPHGKHPFGFELVSTVFRTVYVTVPKVFETSTGERGGSRIADRIWDQLVAITHTQHSLFASKNMRTPDIDTTPAQLVNDEYVVLSGQFEVLAYSKFSRDN